MTHSSSHAATSPALPAAPPAGVRPRLGVVDPGRELLVAERDRAERARSMAAHPAGGARAGRTASWRASGRGIGPGRGPEPEARDAVVIPLSAVRHEARGRAGRAR